MSKIIETFDQCLKSNFSCDKVNEMMIKLSKFKLNEDIDDNKIIIMFNTYCSDHFTEEVREFSRKSKKISDKPIEEIFSISQLIIGKRAQYKNNLFYSLLELFYRTFFFAEYSVENETNDFTFFANLPEHLIETKKYQTYLFNIGKVILEPQAKKGKLEEKLEERLEEKIEKLIEILFSEGIPELLKHIVLVCFQHIRATTKKVSDFIQLCLPSLNHYNLYYLNQKIKADLNFSFTFISELNYKRLEDFISNSNNKNMTGEEPNGNYTNIIIQKSGKLITAHIRQEEISKYFSFPNVDEEKNNLQFFTKDNLKKNKDKFDGLIKSNMLNNYKNENVYKFIYDSSQKEEKCINAFSLAFLLKYDIINKIDEHFFQIYNHGNIKIEIFSYLLKKYLNAINSLLNYSLTNEEKLQLFQNSGFYKLNNEYVLLINVDEKEEKIFYLKHNLGTKNLTTINKDERFKTYQVNQTDYSSIGAGSEISDYYYDDIQDKTLYDFGNYSFENDLRTFIKNYISKNVEVYELPRLFYLLNYAIPISVNEYNFITNVKSQISNNSSYGYSELDFVLRNESSKDIVINPEFLPYKEKIFMTFPKRVLNNNKAIILKKNSVIFFEFKVSFPQFYWKEKFSHFFKKIQKFLELYKKRDLYKKEYIQIYFIYDNMPDIYYIKEMKSYINKNYASLFTNFEFGIYYFSRGISIINNQNTDEKLNDNEKEISKNKENIKNLTTKLDATKTKLDVTTTELDATKTELDKTKNELNKTNNFTKDILNLFKLIEVPGLKEKIEGIKRKYDISN